MNIVHQISLFLRLVARTIARRVRGQIEAEPDRQAFLDQCAAWLQDQSYDALLAAPRFDIPGNKPPWFDTGLDLQAGESVTWLACGRVYLSRALDIWVEPRFQLWGRIGEQGEVFSGTRETHSFTASSAGRLYLASYFPGEWGTSTGELGTDPGDYRKASGGIAVQILQWRADSQPAEELAALARNSAAPPIAGEEIERLADPRADKKSRPAGWRYLWFLGRAEIYQTDEQSPGTIHCHTHKDVGILRTDTPLELTADTELAWEWRMDELPSALAEDSLPTHDYLSIAVEFDNGQDITWYWSAELPPETIYRCPLPTWKHREVHIVIRSGQQGLGEWHRERRNVYQDCINALGAPAERITRVWLISNSLFQRQPGRGAYRDIQLLQAGEPAIDVTGDASTDSGDQ